MSWSWYSMAWFDKMKALGLSTQALVRIGTIPPLLVRFFMRPEWTYLEGTEDWASGNVYPSFGISFLPIGAASYLDLTFLLWLCHTLWLELRPENQGNIYPFYGRSKSIRKRWTVLKVALPCIFIKFVGILWNVVSFHMTGKPGFGFSPIEGLIFVLLEPSMHSSVFYTMRKTLRYFLGLIFILVCIIASWAVIGIVVLRGHSGGYYEDFAQGFWTTVVVMNAANWPDPMIPSFAVDEYRLQSFYYFMFMVIITQWIFLNLILGLIISSFESSWEQRLKKTRERERNKSFLGGGSIISISGSGSLNPLLTTAALTASLSSPKAVSGKGGKGGLPNAKVEIEMRTSGEIENEKEKEKEREGEEGRGGTGSTWLDHQDQEAEVEAETEPEEEKEPGRARESAAEPAPASSPSPSPSSLQFLSVLVKDVSQRWQFKLGFNLLWIFMGLLFIFVSRPDVVLVIILVLQPIILVIRYVGLEEEEARRRQKRADRTVKVLEAYGRDELRGRESFDDPNAHKDVWAGHGGGEEGSTSGELPFSSLSRLSYHVALYLFLVGFSAGFSSMCFKHQVGQIHDQSECTTSILNTGLGLSDNGFLNTTVIGVRLCITLKMFHSMSWIGWSLLLPLRWKLHCRRVLAICRHAEVAVYNWLVATSVCLYIAAVIGTRTYGGKITTNSASHYNQALQGTLYEQSSYWPLNFNDLPSALFTLFTLLYVNNMQVTASGMSAVTSTWSRYYFLVWYVVGPLFLMNILTALVWSRVGAILNSRIMPISGMSSSVSGGSGESGGVDSVPDKEEEKHGGYWGSSSPMLHKVLSLGSPSAGKKQVGRSGQGVPKDWPVPDEEQGQSPASRVPFGAAAQPPSNAKSASQKLFGAVEDLGPAEERIVTSTRSLTEASSASHSAEGRLSRPSERLTDVLDRINPYHSRAGGQAFPASSSPSFSSPSPSLLEPQQAQAQVCAEAEAEPRAGAVGSLERDRDRDRDSVISGTGTGTGTGTATDAAAVEGQILSPQQQSARKVVSARRRRESLAAFLDGTVELSPEERAGVLLQFARRGEIHTLFTTSSALRFFRLRCYLSYPLLVVSWAMTVLRIWILPWWLIPPNRPEDLSQNQYNLYPAIYLSKQSSAGLRIPLLFVVVLGLGLEVLYKLDGQYHLKKLCKVGYSYMTRLFLLLVASLNILVLILSVSAGEKETKAFFIDSKNLRAGDVRGVDHHQGQWQRADWVLSFFSVAYIFWFDRYALRKLVLVVKVVPRLSQLLIILASFILLSMAFAMFVFDLSSLPRGGTSHAEDPDSWDDDYVAGYYSSYGQALWNSFVMTTSSSFPNQIMPCLRQSRLFAVFAVFFVTVGAFLLLDSIMATVNSGFQNGLLMKERHEKHLKRGLCRAAFSVLADYSRIHHPHPGSALGAGPRDGIPLSPHSASGTSAGITRITQGVVGVGVGGADGGEVPSVHSSLAHGLLQEVFEHYTDFNKGAALPALTRELLVNILDMDGDGVLGARDFETVLDVCRVKVERLPVDHPVHAAYDLQKRRLSGGDGGASAVNEALARVGLDSPLQSPSLTPSTSAQSLDEEHLKASRLFLSSSDQPAAGARAGVGVGVPGRIESVDNSLLTDLNLPATPQSKAPSALRRAVMHLQEARWLAAESLFWLFSQERHGSAARSGLLGEGQGQGQGQVNAVVTRSKNMPDIAAFERNRVLAVYREHQQHQQHQQQRGGRTVSTERGGRTTSTATSTAISLGGGADTVLDDATAEQWSSRVILLHGREPLVSKPIWDVSSDSIASTLCALNILASRGLLAGCEHGACPPGTHSSFLFSTLAYFVVEALLKVLVLGWRVYIKEIRNRLDLSVLLAMAALLAIGGAPTETDNSHNFYYKAVEVVTLVRVVVYPRNIACFASPVTGVSWANVAYVIAKLSFTFVEVFLCVYFTYAQLGCWLFGGTILRPGQEQRLDQSPYGKNDFYSLNFNDMPSSFYTLFVAIRVSDFGIVTSGFSSTSGETARLYFLVWYIVGVMLCYNIVRSYLVSVFQVRQRGGRALSKKKKTQHHRGRGSSGSEERGADATAVGASTASMRACSPNSGHESAEAVVSPVHVGGEEEGLSVGPPGRGNAVTESNSDDSVSSSDADEDEDSSEDSWGEEEETEAEAEAEAKAGAEAGAEAGAALTAGPRHSNGHSYGGKSSTSSRYRTRTRADSEGRVNEDADRRQLDSMEARNVSRRGFIIDLGALRRTRTYVGPAEQPVSSAPPPSAASSVTGVQSGAGGDDESAASRGTRRPSVGEALSSLWWGGESTNDTILYRCRLPPLSHLSERTRLRILSRLDQLSRISRPRKRHGRRGSRGEGEHVQHSSGSG